MVAEVNESLHTSLEGILEDLSVRLDRIEQHLTIVSGYHSTPVPAVLAVPNPKGEVVNKFLRDTTERVAATFAVSFLALYVPGLLADGATVHDLTDVGTLGKAAVAGAAAALTLVKSLVASYIGNKDSASLDPAVGAVEPPMPPDDGDGGDEAPEAVA